MIFKIKKILFFATVFCAFLLGASLTFALEVQYPTILGHSVNDTSSLAEYICYLIGLALDLAVLVAIIAVAYGGVYYLVSYGRGKFLNEAKDIIKSAILGLLIIVCATLIAHTINPNLTKCKIGVLSFLGIEAPIPNNENPYGSPVVSYKEIPLGVLTETLLTRTMGCYGFDSEGNPIDGGKIVTDDKKREAGPTYMDHDRTDCLLQLVEGAQAKARVVAALSDEIMKLMNQCDCEKYGDCKPKCNPITGCQYDKCPGGHCFGECIGGACLVTPAIDDCCPTNSGVNDPKTGKELTVKEQIEHGPVSVEVEVGATTGGSCKTQKKKFKGLDEFRCPAPGAKITQCSGIVNIIEKEFEVNGKKIKVIDPDKWEQLNLYQQLAYFEEKITELKESVQADQGVLTGAKNMLQSPQCYLAIPSVDFFRTHTATDQKNKFIKIEKIFSDPETGGLVAAAKYCSGFNYNNSSCFKRCNDECPDTSDDALDAYSEIKDCADKPFDFGCWFQQQEELAEVYGERPCPLSENDSQTYEECVGSCQSDCSEDCAKKYLLCSNDYKTCKKKCEDNSQCVLDNSDVCLFDAQSFRDCANDVADPGNAEYCINAAYLCKGGSEQYAGYPDCVNATTSSSGQKCSLDKFLGSYLFENSECQKCPDPYSPAPAGGICSTETVNPGSSDDDNAENDSLCQNACPETSKCPSSSFCPNCPCNEIEGQSFKFSIPNESIADRENGAFNAGDEGNSTREEKVDDDFSHQIVGPECNEYSYNDDPLTFYCQNEWWNDPDREGQNQTPIGTQRVCLAGGEVPVGQMIDGAQNWANNLINSAEKMRESIGDLLEKMEKAGKAKNHPVIKNYCKCDSKFENSMPICKTDCDYKEEWIPEEVDADGNVIPGHWNCSCDFVPCEGNPCDQLIKYLSDIWNSHRQFRLGFIDLYMVMATEPRSDIMKQLTYSRNQTNACSLIRNNYGARARLLSCSRVQDEWMLPLAGGPTILNGEKISGYCYGQDLNSNLTDNWFCCQKYSADQQNDPLIDQPALP